MLPKSNMYHDLFLYFSRMNDQNLDIHQFKIQNIPDAGFYVPNFISEVEEKLTLDQIGRSSKVKWTQLSNRRLQNWGGVPHPKVVYFKNHILSEMQFQCLYLWFF